MLEDLRPPHRADPLRRLKVLDRVRDPVQEPERPPAHDRVLRRLRLSEGEVGRRGAVAVEGGVERVDPRRHRPRELHGREAAAPDVGREIDRGSEAKVFVVHRCVLLPSGQPTFSRATSSRCS